MEKGGFFPFNLTPFAVSQNSIRSRVWPNTSIAFHLLFLSSNDILQYKFGCCILGEGLDSASCQNRNQSLPTLLFELSLFHDTAIFILAIKRCALLRREGCLQFRILSIGWGHLSPTRVMTGLRPQSPDQIQTMNPRSKCSLLCSPCTMQLLSLSIRLVSAPTQAVLDLLAISVSNVFL